MVDMVCVSAAVLYYFILVSFDLMYFFFFSSRRRHTRCGRDWSSDVCSSDLVVDGVDAAPEQAGLAARVGHHHHAVLAQTSLQAAAVAVEGHRHGIALQVLERSEERRVGKEGRARGWERAQ